MHFLQFGDLFSVSLAIVPHVESALGAKADIAI